MAVEKALPKGVMVKVPTQAKGIKVEIRPMPSNMAAPPGRLLVNFVVVESAKPNKLVTSFKPALKLEVQYKKEDLDRAIEQNKDLTLTFWDGSVWVPFTSKHKFRLQADGNGGGTAFVEIKSWGDPPLAWAP